VHSITDVGTSEHPNAIVLENNDTSQRVREISINYIESKESYDRKTTVVDIYFTESIAKINQNDPDPKSMAECKKRSDWNQWKDAIQAELASPKEKYSVNQYYTSWNLCYGIQMGCCPKTK